MKTGKLVAGLLLWVAVAGLGYWLYSIIQDPVKGKQMYEAKFAATTERMYDIKTAEGFYLKLKGKYAGNFEELSKALKNEIYTEIVMSGDPDDTTTRVSYDTLHYYFKDKYSLNTVSDLDSLQFIPFSGGEKFTLKADTLRMQRVIVPVYEVSCGKMQYLKGIKEEYIEDKPDLVLGSITVATEKASWE